MDEYVTKSVQVNDLLDEIARVCGENPGGEDPSALSPW